MAELFDFSENAIKGDAASLLYNVGDKQDLSVSAAAISREIGKRKNFAKDSIHFLNEWFKTHEDRPYPTKEEKDFLASKTCLSARQISNWFVNKRQRCGRKYKNSSNSPDAVELDKAGSTHLNAVQDSLRGLHELTAAAEQVTKLQENARDDLTESEDEFRSPTHSRGSSEGPEERLERTHPDISQMAGITTSNIDVKREAAFVEVVVAE